MSLLWLGVHGQGDGPRARGGRGAARLLQSLRVSARERERERLNFNCSFVAKYNKVRIQRIEVILSSGLNCFFPEGRGGEGGEIHSFTSNDSGATIYPGRASRKPE